MKSTNSQGNVGSGLVKMIVFCTFLAGAHQGYLETQHVRTAEASEMGSSREGSKMDRLVMKAAQRYNLSETLIRAVINQENGPSNDHRSCRSRFEKSWFNRIKSLPGESPDEKRLRASSWGPMQVVFAPHAKTCGLGGFEELCQLDVGIDCGARVLRDCFDRHKSVKDSYERTRRALVCYNGGEDYPDKIFRHVARLRLNENDLDDTLG